MLQSLVQRIYICVRQRYWNIRSGGFDFRVKRSTLETRWIFYKDEWVYFPLTAIANISVLLCRKRILACFIIPPFGCHKMTANLSLRANESTNAIYRQLTFSIHHKVSLSLERLNCLLNAHFGVTWCNVDHHPQMSGSHYGEQDRLKDINLSGSQLITPPRTGS